MRREKDLEKNKKAIKVQKEMIRKKKIVLDLSCDLLQFKRRVEVLGEPGTSWEGYTLKKARYMYIMRQVGTIENEIGCVNCF